MTLSKDCESYTIKDPEYYEIIEDEIPIEDEMPVNENCKRLFYNIKQENINGKHVVYTVHESEEPDVYDIDNQTPPDYDHRDFIATYRKQVKKLKYRRRHSFRKFSDKHTMIQNQPSHAAESVKQKKKMSEHKIEKYHELGPQIKQPTEDKTRECQICFRTFLKRSNLKRHMAVHANEPVSIRTFKNKISGKKFGERSNYQSAKTHNHKIKEDLKKFSCKLCGKQESSKRDFANHMRVHTGERPFQCELCHLTFKQKSGLRRHTSVHTGEFLYKGKPIQCEICGRFFGQNQQLTRHMKCHNPSSTREYKCDHCPKEFSEKHHLVRHARLHTGEKPYKCDTCDRSFTFHAAYTCHRRIHTKEKPYTCGLCDKSFTQRSTLNFHMHVHSGEPRYKCKVCGEKFGQHHRLKKHKLQLNH